MQEQEIKVCKKCHKIEPCSCSEKCYIILYKWIYDLMKRLNPMG